MIQSGQRIKAPIITIEDLEYSYPTGVTAIKGMSLELRRNEVLSIVGPSGCGKSTLLYMIAGLIKPKQGTVHWNISDEGQADKQTTGPRFTLMFQKETLLPWLTVEHNVAVGLRYVSGMSKGDKRDLVERLLKMVGLTEFRSAYPRQLSGGMKRRAALLASVAPMPDVLLLDEPFASVDEPTRIGIHRDVLAICRAMGLTVIIVTHDLAEAISLGDRVCILTRRPASVANTHDVDMGDDRDMFQIRETDEFQEKYKMLWHELSAQIEGR